MWLVSLFEQLFFIQIHKTFNPSFSFPQPWDISWGFTLWILITWFFFCWKKFAFVTRSASPLRTKNSNQGWIYISSIYHHEHFTASSFVLIEWKNTFSWLCTHRKIRPPFCCRRTMQSEGRKERSFWRGRETRTMTRNSSFAFSRPFVEPVSWDEVPCSLFSTLSYFLPLL